MSDGRIENLSPTRADKPAYVAASVSAPPPETASGPPRSEPDDPGLPLWLPALALLFWGWSSGTPWIAAPLAAIVLAPRFLEGRLAFGRHEFFRVLEVCWVLGLGAVLLIYSRESVGNVFREFVKWLPVVVLPAWLAQIWSEAGRVPVAALIPLPRWRSREHEGSVDLGPGLVAACVLSGSVAGGARPWFYAGLLVVIGGLLWARRSRSSRSWIAALALLLTAGGGWVVAQGLAGFQQWVEDGVLMWTTQWQREGAPGRASRTSIGRTGRVGGTEQVVLKLRNEAPFPLPRLLRTATFTVWRADGESWYAPASRFEKVEGSTDEWVLDPESSGLAGAVQVEWVRGATRNLLPLPANTRVLRDLVAESVQSTVLGTVRADARPGVITFRAEQSMGGMGEAEPGHEDTHGIPKIEWDVIRVVAEELGIVGLPAEQAAQRIASFFRREFEYTLDLVDAGGDPAVPTPLGRFLLHHRRGHCEYFATAGVLLLRAAGVPARYATGYLVRPQGPAGETATVRASQAHAWVRMWSDGAWRDFDPTPPGEEIIAEESRTWWGRLSRRTHELRYELLRWWWLGEKPLLRQAYWLALPLLVGLFWRMGRLRAAARGRQDSPLERTWPGSDSEWYPIDLELARRGLAPGDREPPRTWRQRLAAAGWNGEDAETMVAAHDLHERLRFDPTGLTPEDRERLRHLARTLSRAFQESPGGAR